MRIAYCSNIPCLAYLKNRKSYFCYYNILLLKMRVFAKRVKGVFNICFSGHTLAHLLTEVGGDPWCPNPSAQMGCYPAARPTITRGHTGALFLLAYRRSSDILISEFFFLVFRIWL